METKRLKLWREERLKAKDQCNLRVAIVKCENWVQTSDCRPYYHHIAIDCDIM